MSEDVMWIKRKEGNFLMRPNEPVKRTWELGSNETVVRPWVAKCAGLLMPKAIYKLKEAGRSLRMVSQPLYYDSSFMIFIMILFRFLR